MGTGSFSFGSVLFASSILCWRRSSGGFPIVFFIFVILESKTIHDFNYLPEIKGGTVGGLSKFFKRLLNLFDA